MTAIARAQAASRPQSELHVPALDGVRGVAILAVLLVHLEWRLSDTILDRVVTSITNCGWMGVDLFFVLSGFLITGILIDTKDNPHYFKSFYARRALRILPLYWSFVAFFVLVLPIVHTRTATMQLLLRNQGWLWAVATNIWAARDGLNTIPYNLGITWSLGIEEQFYLVWPFIVWRTSRVTLLRVCAGIIVAAFILRLAIASRWPSAAYVLMPARMDAFALGGVVAILVRRPRGLVYLKRLGLPLAACATASIIAMYMVRGNMETADLSLGTLGYASADWLSVSVLALALTRASAAFSNPVLRFFGRYSYAIYLFHYPVMIPMAPLTTWLGARSPILGTRLPWMCLSMLAIGGVAVALSLASWVLLERPFLRLKRRFSYS